MPVLPGQFTSPPVTLPSWRAARAISTAADRLWGYLYYHADNLLLYFTIREFCPEKKFDPLTRRFHTARVNRASAYSLLSAALCVKIAEVVHAVLIRDNIMNGDIIEEGYMFEPVIYSGENAGTNFGLQYSYRW